MSNTRIVCGKFDNHIIIKQNGGLNKKIRIGSTNPNSFKKIEYIPISTNGKNIFYKGEEYEVREFFSTTDQNTLNNLIVLTITERSLILEVLLDFNMEIKVFEVLFPIFDNIRYTSSISSNYNYLITLLKRIDPLNIKGKSLSHLYSSEYLFKIERKLRFKRKVDYYFAFAYRGGYQEVFKLKEEREDRVVIALDFNSMYVDCMMGDFLEPKSIEYINFKKQNINIEDIPEGLYRVIMKNPKNTFFKFFHPFKYTKLNLSFYFNLEEDQEVEVFLFKNEISYYKSFFCSIEIIEGFSSKKTITHPLKNYALSLYRDRLKYKKNKNFIMEKLCKFKLITIHSSTNNKKFKNILFNSKNDFLKYMSLKYMISFPMNKSIDEKIKSIIDYKYFFLKKKPNGYQAKVIDYENYSSVYSLSSQITANSRLKIIKTIEIFLSHNSVEICYSNIDSLHVSILKTEVDSFLEKNKGIISNKLGDLKVESISNKGYWFDVGRYWLITNNKVDLFKNIFFNNRYNGKFFIKNKTINIIYKGDFFNYVKNIYVNIYSTFSYGKKIDLHSYKRYNYLEIKNLEVAKESYDIEIFKSKKIKIELYNKIATALVF